MLEKGVDEDLKDCHRKTAMDYAILNFVRLIENIALIKILKSSIRGKTSRSNQNIKAH